MKFSKSKLKEQYKSLYSSQDSKFFIATATKLTLIPIFSFFIIFYSLWTIMEMNFNFFVANGFTSGELFKEAFYDSVFMGVSDFIPFFFGVVISVFMSGLLVSWLILRSFDQIERFAADSMEHELDDDFEVKGLNKSKLINQVSRIFFKYLQICHREGQRPRFKLPKKLENLKHPPFDKVFLLQYALIVSAICLVTNIVLFTFTNELYLELVNKGLSLLEPNKVVNNFLKSQEAILFNIYSIAIGVNVVLYLLISKNIIKSVDGVSFGFARDMLSIIKGEHEVRLRPRYTDPGKSIAGMVNLYLDEVFPFVEEEEDGESLESLAEQSFEQLHEIDNHHADDDSFFDDDREEDELVSSVPHFDELVEVEEDDSDTVIAAFPEPEHQSGEQETTEDLPPAFIEEKQVANGEKVFHITTPEGLKVENVDAEMLLRIVKESKK